MRRFVAATSVTQLFINNELRNVHVSKLSRIIIALQLFCMLMYQEL